MQFTPASVHQDTQDLLQSRVLVKFGPDVPQCELLQKTLESGYDRDRRFADEDGLVFGWFALFTPSSALQPTETAFCLAWEAIAANVRRMLEVDRFSRLLRYSLVAVSMQRTPNAPDDGDRPMHDCALLFLARKTGATFELDQQLAR